MPSISKSSILVKKSWIITILKYQVCLDQILRLRRYILWTLRHRHTRTLQRLDLLPGSPAAPADYGTGVTHGLTRRRADPHHITHHRLGHMLPDVFGSLLLGRALFEYIFETDQDADAALLAIYLYDWT